MNKKTVALTKEQFKNIIQTMRTGFTGCRANERVAMALMIEGNLGIRISDIVALKLSDIRKNGDRYELNIVEQKTGKKRTFTVPIEIYSYIQTYCINNGIKRNVCIIPLTERDVQKVLKQVCDYLGYQDIGTHSFRKYYATEIYRNNGYDIALVQTLLQHSSPAITYRYIGIGSERLEKAIQGNLMLF